MKNKKQAFIVGITTLLFACNAKKDEATVVEDKEQKEQTAVVVDKEQIKREIQAKETEFAETYNQGVLKNIGYYADDATSFYQNRAPIRGKNAIVEFLSADLGSNSNKISYRTDEVFVSNDGNMVVEIGYFKVMDSTAKTVNSGNYMSLFEKRNGRYVCVRDMSASDIPLR